MDGQEGGRGACTSEPTEKRSEHRKGAGSAGLSSVLEGPWREELCFRLFSEEPEVGGPLGWRLQGWRSIWSLSQQLASTWSWAGGPQRSGLCFSPSAPCPPGIQADRRGDCMDVYKPVAGPAPSLYYVFSGMPESPAVQRSGSDRGLQPGCLVGLGALPLADQDRSASASHSEVSQRCCLGPSGWCGLARMRPPRGSEPACHFTGANSASLTAEEAVALLEARQAPSSTALPIPGPGVWETGLWAVVILEKDWARYFLNPAVLWRITISDTIHMSFRYFNTFRWLKMTEERVYFLFCFLYTSPSGFQEF